MKCSDFRKGEFIMKKIIKIMFSLSVLLLMSCVEEIDYSLPRNEVSRNITTVSNDTITNHELLEEFSKALAYSLDSSIELRRIIKNEALKMFDYDYDVLYLSINSYRLTSGKTVDELMSLYMDITRLEKIKQLFSTLTIFVPELPDNSFSAELWNVESEVPYTALRVKNSNDVMGYGVNKEFLIPSNEIPKYPIVVVKLNERVVSVNKAQRNLSPMSIINPDIVFFSDVFDNTENASSVIQNRNFSSGDTRDRTGSIPENMKKVYEAYDVFAATNEWPRDYIYYGLTPQQPKGPFNRDFKESLVYFKLLGDPRTVMNKICDQSEDPRIDGNTHQETGGGRPGGSTILTPWTDGSLEFIVKVYVANQAGIGNEYINNFIVKPSALFKITPKDPLSSKFEVKSIELTDGIALDLPLFEWNIENYGAIIKIAIEELDISETIQSVESSTATFATNFGFDPSFGEKVKIGLKFGATATTSKTVSYTVTKSLASDELGQVIVNFEDKILKSKKNLSTGRDWKPDYTDKYRTGWYQLALSPLKYN